MPTPVPAVEARPLVAAALAASRVVRLLSEPARQGLARAGSPLALEAGQYLCQEGDRGDAVYIVLEGEIEVLTRAEGGKAVRHAALGRGDLAGEMAVLDGGLRSADMVAASRCRLWRVPRQTLLAAFEDEPKAAVALVVELSGRLRAANAALAASSVLDLGGRVARLLIEEKRAGGLVAMTQTEMARRLGASREKVNRKLHAWVAQGWVELTPAGVRLIATDALTALIERARRR